MRHDPAWHSHKSCPGYSARGSAPVRFHHHDRGRPGRPPAYVSPTLQLKNTPKRPGRNRYGAKNAHPRQFRDGLKVEIPIVQPSPPAGSFLGDFRTPDGIRNSSRLTDCQLWGASSEKRTYRPIASRAVTTPQTRDQNMTTIVPNDDRRQPSQCSFRCCRSRYVA